MFEAPIYIIQKPSSKIYDLRSFQHYSNHFHIINSTKYRASKSFKMQSFKAIVALVSFGALSVTASPIEAKADRQVLLSLRSTGDCTGDLNLVTIANSGCLPVSNKRSIQVLNFE